jgi:hypothetical protein
MFRSLLLCGLLLFGPPGFAWAAPGPEAKPNKSDQLLANLRKTVAFRGFDADPKLTLQDALEHLADQYGLAFDVNEAAFKAEANEDVLGRAVAEKALPPMPRTTPVAVLKRILSRVSTASGAAWLLRGEHVEITTRSAIQAEVWGAEYTGPFLPLTHARFDKTPLADALKELADQTGFNVVLDPKAGDKAKTSVTARLTNLPLDTAVETLADMAGLQLSRSDNVLYVTADGRPLRKQPAAADDFTPRQFGPLGGGLGVKQVAFDKKPLNEALKELAEGTGYTLVIDDARLGDKAKAPVTADIKGVTVDTAMRLVADLAGARLVIIDNAAYLTTPDNARDLVTEQQLRLTERMLAPNPFLPRQ